MPKALHIVASPNSQKDDVILAFKELISLPYKLGRTGNIKTLESLIEKDNVGYQVFSFDSARTALYKLLQAFGVKEDDEIIVMSFSCHVVPNSILWAGAKPVFIDVNPITYNFDINDFKAKLSAKTRGVIIQNTFGIPEQFSQLKNLINDSTFVIADLAHDITLLPIISKEIQVDAAIMTFGIEKVISGVRGGIALINENSRFHIEKQMMTDDLKKFPISKTIINLINPIFWAINSKIYYWGIGKFTLGRILAAFGHAVGILGNIIEKPEYSCRKPNWMPAKMSNPLASLIVNQYRKLAQFNSHRQNIVSVYNNELGLNLPNRPLLRYPVRVKNRSKVIAKLKKNGFIVGDWYRSPLHVDQHTHDLLGYVAGSCTKTEILCREIINLPTFIKVNEVDAKLISSIVKPYLLV